MYEMVEQNISGVKLERLRQNAVKNIRFFGNCSRCA